MNITPKTKLTLLFLSVTTMMANVAIVTSLPHLKEYFSDVENIEFLARMMLTIPSMAIAILAPFLGHLIEKIGKKISIIIGLLLFSIAGSAGLYLDTIEELLLSRSALGVAIAILMIVSTSLVGDYFHKEERHKFMGLQNGFISLGGMLFVVGGGLLSDLDWRYPFGIYLAGLLLLFPVFRHIVEKENKHEEIDTKEQGTSLGGIYFLAFLHMAIFFILPTQFPFLLVEKFQASGKITGLIIALSFIFSGVGSVSFAYFKRKFSFGAIYLIGMVMVGCGMLLVGFFSSLYQFFITSPVLGFGGGLLTTNTVAWMLSSTPQERRVKSSGYLTSFFFLGQFCSPIMFHPFVEFFGVQGFFKFIGVCIGVGVVGSYLYARVFKKS